MNAIRTLSVSVLVVALVSPAHAARGYVIRSAAARRVVTVRPAPTVIAPTPTPVIIQVDPAAAAKAEKERDARRSAIDLAEKQRNERALQGVDERVVKFLRQRMEDGSVDAPYELAQRHESGKGVPVDPTEARRLYGVAAARGNRDAARWLADHPASSAKALTP